MTQDEISEMAREAGGSDVGGPGWTTWVGTQSAEFLERFVNLVAAKALAQTQDGQCKRCTDGCPACDARKLQKEAHDLL